MQCRALSDISEQNIDAILIPTVNCIENIFCMQQNKKIFLKKYILRALKRPKPFTNIIKAMLSRKVKDIDQRKDLRFISMLN